MRNLILLLISSSLSANPTSWGDQNSGDDISIIFYFWVFMITAVIPYVGYMIFKDAETFFEKLISVALTISFSIFWINLLGYLPLTADAAWFIAGLFGQQIKGEFMLWSFVVSLALVFIIRKQNSEKESG
jgi:hypothetical protein